MLTPSAVAALRTREFARLDETGDAYLDYTGSALAPASLVEAHRSAITGATFGNPHAAHAASRRSTTLMDDARTAVLAFFGVDASTHIVCFTANASAAIKLVAESYPFGPERGFVLSRDNHNSVNGCREYRAPARCASALRSARR